MSYTRWSTDNFRSDVYCYPHIDGHYQLEIASSREMESSEDTNSRVRYRMPIDLPYAGHSFSFDTLKELYNKVRYRMPIDLPYAGHSFSFDTLEELFNKLTELKILGYYIADSAFNNIEKGIKNAT